MNIPKLPTRFENINVKNKEVLKNFILRNNKAIRHIRTMIVNMESSNSGAFLLLKGESGIGKTTLINTLPFFLINQNILIEAVDEKKDLREYLNKCKEVRNGIRLIVLEGREFSSQVKFSELEKSLTAINQFIRSQQGKNTIVVWPCNGEEMVQDILYFSSQIGGTSLFRDDTVFELEGPDESDYYGILKNTFYILNQEDIEDDYGVTKAEAAKIRTNLEKITIGSFLEKTRSNLIQNILKIDGAFQDYDYESFKLWILVIAKNNPLDDVTYLTKGNYANVDFQRLLSSTSGNISHKIQKNSNIIGLLAKELDCRILYIPYELVTNSITSTKNDALKKLLSQNGVKIHNSATKRIDILKSSLGSAITGSQIHYKRTTSKIEDSQLSQDFSNILKITQNNDRIANEELGKILEENELVYSSRPEQSFGLNYSVRTDLLCGIEGNYLRLEMMWRTSTTRGEIANYVLQKLLNYASAMGIIE